MFNLKTFSFGRIILYVIEMTNSFFVIKKKYMIKSFFVISNQALNWAHIKKLSQLIQWLWGDRISHNNS